MEHNKKIITYVVGNGFDIGVLTKLGKDYKTSYQEFYDYLTYFLKDKQKNSIYQKIIKDKQGNDYLWSDYELLLENIVLEKKKEIKEALNDEKKEEIYQSFMKNWEEIQYKFSDFLNFVITPDTLMEVSNLKGLSNLEKCIGDLSKEEFDKLKFKNLPDNYDLIQYNILNFNYSTLADNYFFHLHDPHPYKNSSNNSFFYYDPKGYHSSKNDRKYLKTKYKLYHPHGQLSIPASILFGMSYDNQKYKSSTQDNSRYFNNYEEDIVKKMDKLYWCDSKYEIIEEINSTSLFIIFGHSIGKSDEWWWKKIMTVLARDESELIIYEYHPEGVDNIDKSELKNRFLTYIDSSFNEFEKRTIEDNIYVIHFDDKENTLDLTFNFDIKSIN